MSPAMIQLLFALAQQIPSAVAAAQAMIADKGNPSEQDWSNLAEQMATDRAAAEAAIQQAQSGST